MASTAVKSYCTKCEERKRVAAVACNGCQQLFCATCIVNHRQELAAQIVDINREHKYLQETLSQKYDTGAILSRINMWEQESIAKIQAAAESARVNFQELIDRNKNQVKLLLDTITNNLESSQKINDYPEVDLQKWIEQLKELREMMDDSLNIDIVNQTDAESSIYLIKVKEIRNQQESSILASERFDATAGAVALSGGGLRAGHLDHIGTNGSTCGVNLYSSGIHHIRFQIVGDWGRNFFSGIMTSLQEIQSRATETPSVYGWWDFDGSVINGKGQLFGTPDFISKDDELTLTLNCDKRRIELEHHRTNKGVNLSVDLEMCPFPWKFLVGFDWRGGSVRILH